MRTDEVFGLAGSVVVLAMVSVAIINGKQTAAVATSSFEGFGNLIRSATLQKR
jgi:hypothetical protein